jgi:hypothetical protein
VLSTFSPLLLPV